MTEHNFRDLRGQYRMHSAGRRGRAVHGPPVAGSCRPPQRVLAERRATSRSSSRVDPAGRCLEATAAVHTRTRGRHLPSTSRGHGCVLDGVVEQRVDGQLVQLVMLWVRMKMTSVQVNGPLLAGSVQYHQL